MRVRLIRKLANSLNGVDLKKVRVGEVVDMSNSEASMLIAEGWAEPLTARQENRPYERVKEPRSR